MQVVVEVAVPATSANLGPGFDAVGLALDLHDTVTLTLRPGPLAVEVAGEGAGTLPTDEGHLVVAALLAGAARWGVVVPGLALRCVNRIPQGRGLGSSAAARVAGVLAAWTLAGGRGLAEPLALAAELEGHPDNVAACLAGGAVLVVDGRLVRLAVADGLAPVLLVPAAVADTAAARALLPASVPHADAVANAARAALLVEALRTGAPDLLLAATDDRLHQPYRAPAMPATAALVADLRDRGVPAAVSGAGPSVLALGPVGPAPAGWRVLELAVDRRGAVARLPGLPPADGP